jgi:peroxiredoxin
VTSFHSAGVYHLTVEAVDGAGNRTSSVLSDAVVSPAATVVDAHQKPVAGARVTLYYRLSDTGEWAVWDGAGLGQANPQTTTADGAFRLLVPAGSYYLKVTAPGQRTLLTRQFAMDRSAPLVPVITMAARPGFRLGAIALTWPWFSLVQIRVAPAPVVAMTAMLLTGQSLPGFELPATTNLGDAGVISQVGLLGKPTLVTCLATWVPSANEQLPALAALQADHTVNVVPLIRGERVSRVQAFLNRAGLTTTATVDADAILSQALGVPSVPTHYLIDRNGVIRQVLTGVQTEGQLQAALARLK